LIQFSFSSSWHINRSHRNCRVETLHARVVPERSQKVFIDVRIDRISGSDMYFPICEEFGCSKRRYAEHRLSTFKR
jgi:hypothetical protein